MRVNNEFYVYPVCNEAIKNNKKIVIRAVDEVYRLETLEDLNNLIQYLKD